jgi:hypothetical protein
MCSAFESNKRPYSLLTLHKNKYSMDYISTHLDRLWCNVQLSNSIVGRITLSMATHLSPHLPISYLSFSAAMTQRVGLSFTRFAERYEQQICYNRPRSRFKDFLLQWTWLKTPGPRPGGKGISSQPRQWSYPCWSDRVHTCCSGRESEIRAGFSQNADSSSKSSSGTDLLQ